MKSPPPPENVVATVNANDSISLEWTFDYSSASVDNYEVQISRDGASFTDPTGGPSSPTGTGPHTYGPNSHESYNSVVGIDSSFQFRVRAVNTDGTSDWNVSPTVYTDPIPPENVVATASSDTTIDVSWSNESNNEDGFRVHQKSDSSSWQQQADLAPEYHLDLSRTEVPLTTDKTLSATGGTFLVV